MVKQCIHIKYIHIKNIYTYIIHVKLYIHICVYIYINVSRIHPYPMNIPSDDPSESINLCSWWPFSYAPWLPSSSNDDRGSEGLLRTKRCALRYCPRSIDRTQAVNIPSGNLLHSY